MKASDREAVLGQVAMESGNTEAQIALNWFIAKDNVVAISRASTAAHASKTELPAGVSYRTNTRCWKGSSVPSATGR
jgi:diketogulonate reductase-like aldo/keto reductase